MKFAQKIFRKDFIYLKCFSTHMFTTRKCFTRMMLTPSYAFCATPLAVRSRFTLYY